MKTKQPQQFKSQWWASIIYPNDFITTEYIDRVIIQCHIPCILSPLHDRDSLDGYPLRSGLRNELIEDIWKKPHRHIMFMFPRAVACQTYDYILKKFYDFGIQLVGAEMVGNGTAMARYFVHMDNPEKAQYKVSDMLYYGGLNQSILKLDKMNSIQQDKIRNIVVQTIINKKLIDVIEVYMYFQSIGEDMLSDYALKNTALVEKFCRANYYRYNPRVPPRQKHEVIT